jgi:hypothetical protein
MASEALCKPGTWTCASDTVGKECDRDGMSWLMSACSPGERCSTDRAVRCEPDPKAKTCAAGSSVCLDDGTALHCAPDGSGYTLQTCPASAPCADGLCKGPLCVAGESRCDIAFSTAGTHASVSTCADGKSWTQKACRLGQVCVFDGIARSDAPALSTWWIAGQVGKPPVALPVPLTASCEDSDCNPEVGDDVLPVCGNPMRPELSSTEYYSVCEGLLPFASAEWVSYRCPAPAECDSNLLRNNFVPCSTGCFSGDMRCSPDGGLQVCDDAGNWGAAQACAGGRVCAGSYDFPASCVDAECAFFINGHRLGVGGGRCESVSKFRPCDGDGMLGPVDDSCNHCVPDPGAVSTPLTPERYSPGTCEQPYSTSFCERGEQMCASQAQYWECAGTTWSGAELFRCPVGTECFESREPTTGKQAVVCGECPPSDTTCVDDTHPKTCGPNGYWEEPTTCKLGVCQWGQLPTGNTGAGCRVECLPGTVTCNSATQYRACQADGRYSAATFSCLNGTTCRTDSAGVGIGCLQCLGPSHTLGNRVNDSRCEGNALVECLANDSWGPAQDCGASAYCQQSTSPFDGSSPSARCVLRK